MPIYEYECPSCRQEFEQLVSVQTSTKSVCCPGCGQKGVQRKISVFSAKVAPANPACPMANEGMCGKRCRPGDSCGMM